MDKGSGQVSCVAVGTGHTKAVGAVAFPRSGLALFDSQTLGLGILLVHALLHNVVFQVACHVSGLGQ